MDFEEPSAAEMTAFEHELCSFCEAGGSSIPTGVERRCSSGFGAMQEFTALFRFTVLLTQHLPVDPTRMLSTPIKPSHLLIVPVLSSAAKTPLPGAANAWEMFTSSAAQGDSKCDMRARFRDAEDMLAAIVITYNIGR